MAESTPTAAWWAEGDLFEGCNCNVVCPCHADFRQNSTHETCDNLWGIHIDAGGYGGLDLSGLNALVVAGSPGPSMFAGNWTALVFVDDQSTPEQYAALDEILSGRAGGPWERMARFYAGEAPQFCQPAAFAFSKSDRSRTLEVADVASLQVDAIRGADRDEPVTISNLYNVIHGPEHVIARSQLTLDAGGLKWDTSGTHGLYSRFHWSNH